MITANQLYSKRIEASDGHLGSVHDVYVDEQAWTIRYVVVDTGNWLSGRKVLLSPEAIVLPWHAEASNVAVNLTKEEIRSSPDLETAQLVSRKAEGLLHTQYGWIFSWEVPGVPVPLPLPTGPAVWSEGREETLPRAEQTDDSHICSTKEIRGYRVHATDNNVGHIDDVLFDDECRRVLFLAVDVEEWLLAKEVLIASRLISRIDWVNSEVDVDLPCRVIKSSQEYKPGD